MSSSPVVVLGGGISGLALGFALGSRGVDVRVIESRDRPGGNIRTEVIDGFRFEWGPNGFLDSEPATLRLVDELGLTGELVRANAASAIRYLVRGGRLRRLPAKPPAFLTSDVLSFGGRLRCLVEWAQAKKSDDSDESVHQFASRRIGREAADVLVDAMVTGVFAGDSRRLSLRSAFPKMYDMEQSHGSLVLAMRARRRAGGGGPMGPAGTLTSFKTGMETIIHRLSQRLGDRLVLDSRPIAIEPEGDGYQIRFEGESLFARRVVIATPSSVTSGLVSEFAPELATELREIETAPVAVVALGFRAADVAATPPGFGFLVPGGENLPILGTLFDSAVYPGRAPQGAALWRTMVGGARDPKAVDETDAQLIDRTLDTADRLLGFRPEPTMTRVVRHSLGIPQYVVGHRERLGRIASHLARHPGLHLSGSSYNGVALNACIKEAEELAASL